jgi:hypothetical protein
VCVYCRWDFPDESVVAALESRILESQQKVAEAVEVKFLTLSLTSAELFLQKRRLERLEQNRQQAARDEESDQLQVHLRRTRIRKLYDL